MVLDLSFEVSFVNFCKSLGKPLSSSMRLRKLLDLVVHAAVGPDGATMKVSDQDGIGMGE